MLRLPLLSIRNDLASQQAESSPWQSLARLQHDTVVPPLAAAHVLLGGVCFFLLSFCKFSQGNEQDSDHPLFKRVPL